MAWAAMLGGAVLGYMGDRSASKAAKGAGTVDVTTRNMPWGPDEAYRKYGMEHAYNLLGGQWGDRTTTVNGEPRTSRTPTGFPMPGAAPGATPAGGRVRRGGGGGGMGAGTAQGFSGVSPETTRLLGGLTDRAEGGHVLYDPSNEFVQNLLAGQDPNAYRAETFGALRDLNDPNLSRFTEMLFAGQMPGSAPGGSRSGMSGGGGFYGGGGGAGVPTGAFDADLVGAKGYLQEILEGKYLDQENPHKQAMLDAATRGIQRKFSEEKIPGINAEYTGAGRFGGKMYEGALGKAAGEYTTSLGDVIGGIEYDEYEARMADLQNALGLGTSYDVSMEELAAQRAAAAESANASRAASAASAYGADRESQDRMALARMGALQDAIGMGMGMNELRLGGMGSLAGLYGDDQMGALSMVPGLSGLDIRDLGAAGDLSLGADQNRIGMEDIRARSRDAAAGRSLQRSGLDWEKERYGREEPWLNAMRYMDLINAGSAGYGTQTTFGRDQRSQAPYAGNPWGQALAGGLAGWYGAGGKSYVGQQPGRG